MIRELGKNLVALKKEFAKKEEEEEKPGDGKSQIQEVIPKSKSELFPIEDSHLKLLHKFAQENPIYYNSFERIIGTVKCTVYEGDINRYWLNSIQHGSSKAPFSPTWMMSGYVCTLLAKELGYSEIIDVGSGDGRIAFCAKILGMDSSSIEIDQTLVELQNHLIPILDFNPYCSDAVSFEYSSLNLTRPIFFIGGLAQMGGTSLASGVLDKIKSISHLKNKSGWAFAGTLSKKYSVDPKNEAGWGTLLYENNLKCVQNIQLPTAWTFRESDETPYIFAEPSQ